MRVRKNALLLFSKVPEPGLVKTRLTRLKDGIFTPLSSAMLFTMKLGPLPMYVREPKNTAPMQMARR